MHWFVIAGFAVLLICCVLSAIREQLQQFEPKRDMERYISDEEFLAACSVKDPEVALKVRAILSDALGIDEHNIHPDDRLVHELGAW